MEPEEFVDKITEEDAELVDYENKVLVLWVDYSKYESVQDNVGLQELCEDISQTLGVSILALPSDISGIESSGLEELKQKLDAISENIANRL